MPTRRSARLASKSGHSPPRVGGPIVGASVRTAPRNFITIDNSKSSFTPGSGSATIWTPRSPPRKTMVASGSLGLRGGVLAMEWITLSALRHHFLHNSLDELRGPVFGSAELAFE